MAAYAALLSLKFIINQIQQHPQPPISLDQQQLLSLTEKLDFLQNFLETFSKELEEDELESRIADAAYAAEDVIESHIIDQIHAGSTCHAENISCHAMYEGLERVIQDVDLIKKEVTEIVEVKKMGAQLHQLMIGTNSLVSVDPVRPVPRMQNNIVVDFGDILNDVMYKLTGQDSNLEIIPIVGMGGIEGMQNQFSLPDSLKKLSLLRTRFLWEDLNTKIGSLPLLQYLSLGSDSCIGPEWKTLEGQFQSLKFLIIHTIDLKCWVIDGPHFPCLEHLCLQFLKRLEEIPSSIGDIPTLKMINLSYCSKSVDTSAERIKEEQLSYGNEDLQVKIRRY